MYKLCILNKSICLVCNRMAAQATDRPWSSTQVVGAYQVPAAAAPQTRETRRCRCCPYGYHIDVDFLDYLKAGSGLSKLKKIHGHRLRQRQAMETQLLMIRPPTSTPPPLEQRLGSDSGGTDLSESSGSSSPVAPWSPSEDERDSTFTTAAAAERHQLMADLDASIADALDSIEALMQPRRIRTTESSYDGTATTGTATAGCRSISTGDVRWSSGGIDGHTSASTSTVMQLPCDPPSPLSSVSCSTLHDDSKYIASSTPDVFQPTSTQTFGVDSRGGNNDSNSHSSAFTEPRGQSETRSVSTIVATTTVFQESSKYLPLSSGVPATADKSYVPRPPVEPRTAISVGIGRDHSSEGSADDGSATTAFSSCTVADTGTDATHRLPAADRTSEILLRRVPAVEKRQTGQRSTVSDSNISVQTTSTSLSVSTTTTGFADVSSSGRQLPALPVPTEPETSSTRASKESSFSSVRALINRKSGGTQRTGAARVDRPVRRSRHQVGETVQTKITSDDVISAPAVALLPDETASASDPSTTTVEHHLQTSKNERTETAMTLICATTPQAESGEPVSASSCSRPAEVDEVEATQPQSSVLPSSLSRDQIDHDSLEVSFQELTKAMAILSPVVEGSRAADDTKFDQSESSVPPAINPDVLMTIRKYIASSLQQMRMLEQQVKLIPVLQLRVSVLKEDKRLLKLQLQKVKNGSSVTTSKVDACVGVTLSELPVAGKEKDLPMQVKMGNLPDQLRSPVECRDVGVGDSCVEINADCRLYCPSCNSALRQHSWQSRSSAETVTELSKHAAEETSHQLQKSESETENVGYPSVSLLISRLEGEDKNDPPSTRRSWSVEKAIHGSVTSPKAEVALADTACTLTAETSAFAAVRRPKPAVPRKEISIRREAGKNQCTVGIQCTLLKDNKEDHQGSGREIFPPELDTVNRRIVIERADFRAYEPDLVTTHCIGGLSQNEHELRPAAVSPLKTFADKETETDKTSQHSAAVNTVSATVEENLFKFSSDDTQSPVQTIHCSVNTDITGDIWSAAEYQMSTGEEHSMTFKNMHTQLDVRLEPGVCGQRTAVNDFMDTRPKYEGTTGNSTQSSSVVNISQDVLCKNFKHFTRDASRSVDIVTKPATSDASSWTDESLLSPLMGDVSTLQFAVEVKPSVRDVECLADITTKPSVATIACNTETSWDQLLGGSKISVREIGCGTSELAMEPVAKDVAYTYVDNASGKAKKDIRISDAKDAFCQTETEKKPLTREVACGHSHTAESVDHPQLMNFELLTDSRRGPPSNLVDTACGDDDIRVSVTTSVRTDVGCNTEIKAKRDAEFSTTEEKQLTNHVSCSADIKLSVCDKSSSTVTEFIGETVKAGEGLTPRQSSKTVTSRDVACLTDSLTTCEMSSNTEMYATASGSLPTGARLSTAEAGCLTDILWKPPTNEIGCNTDVETTSLSNMVAVPSAENALALRPHSTSVALNTDAWLLTSDLTFLHTMKQILRPSVTESASMTDIIEKLQTSDASTSPMSVDMKRHTSECSTNTDAEVKPSLVDVESLARPAVCEAGCNTEVEDKKRQVRDAANSVDIILRPSVSDASVNTDVKAETVFSVASSSSPLLTRLASGATGVLPNLKDASSATDSLTMCHVSVGTEATPEPLNVDIKRHTSECSTNTDAEVKPSLIDVESLARPAVCEAGCNTEVEDRKRQVRDAAISVDIILRPSVSDASVNTDAEAETVALLTPLASGATVVLSNLKDSSSATDSLTVCHVSVGTEVTPKPLNADAVAQTEQAASVVLESWSEIHHSSASYGADTVERQDKEVTAKADTAEVACIVALRPPLRSIACGIDAEVVSDHESHFDSVSDAADLQSVDDVKDILYEKDIPSEIRRPKNVADLHDAEAPVFRETCEVACNTENMPVPWVFNDISHPSCDVDSLKDFSAISTVYWTNDEGAQICRLCRVQNVLKPSVESDASISDISAQPISPHKTDITPERKWSEELLSSKGAGLFAGHSRATESPGVQETDLQGDTVDSMVGWRQVGVGMRPETKDAGCDAGRILTADTAINTDFSIDMLETKQATLEAAGVSDFRQVHSAVGSNLHSDVAVFCSTRDTASMTEPLQPLESIPVRNTKDVACGTSDVILPTYEEACNNSDNASFQVDTAVQAKLVAATAVLDRTSAVDESVSTVTKCPTCLAKPTTRDSSCGTDSPSLSGDLRHSAADHVESALSSRAVREVGCNTDWPRTTTAEAACNTEPRTPTCDVSLNTEAAMDVARKPSRIPHKSAAATRRTDALVVKPVTKDAFCITDIVIAPSDENEVLRKTDDKEASSAVVNLPSTAEVACNTDAINNVETSISVGAQKLGPTVRTVGCSVDLTSLDKKPSKKDAGCTARPETKSRSCFTDPVSLEPVTETPVKAVERTKTGLQITRKVKSQSVTTTRPTDTLSTPTTPNAPVVAAAKSPTFDVACGTDLEFNSKYFNMDDGGLLRQLSADDVAEVLRRRCPSSSLTSPTCDVACNTEHDSRPCTPARVNYSSYYAVAAVDPMPPTAADAACGPDTPSPELCDVGCGTEDNVKATPFQTPSDVNICIPSTTTQNGSHSIRSPPLPESTSHRRTERRVLPLAPADESLHRQTEVKQGSLSKTINASVETERPPMSQEQSCDTSDLPETFSQPQVHLELSATNTSNEGTLMANTKPEKWKCEERHTTSTAVGDFDVREELVLKSHTVGRSSLVCSESQVSAASRNLQLDVGLASRTDEQTASRHEDFNNNDDEQRTDDFQTYSSDSRWNAELESPTRLVLETRHDVKFIDDDDDSELDCIAQKGSDRRTTKNIITGDEDLGSSTMAADLGRRWGTVDLIPKPTAVSPSPTPDGAPLKSIMKSPKSSSEKTLSKTKRGISFSQDTVFK